MLKGTLDDFALSDVLRLLSASKKTGRLQLTRPAGTGYLSFADGDVVYAETELSSSLLGQKLLRSGAIDDGQLRLALDEQARRNERLGKVLLEAGSVTHDALEEAVRSQVQDAALELLCWEVGEFAWSSAAPEEMDVDVSLSVENLILDASRRLEELDVVKRKISSPDVVLKMATRPPEGASEINITPAEWRILVLVDGTRSVAEIAAAAGVDVADAMRVAFGLASTGLIEVDLDRGEGGTAEPTTPAAPWQAATAAGPASSHPQDAPPDEWFKDPDEPLEQLITASSIVPAQGGAASDAALAVDADPAPDDPSDAPAFPAASGDDPDLPGLDRAAAVRELSGLFDEPRRAAPPPAPPPRTTAEEGEGRRILSRWRRDP